MSKRRTRNRRFITGFTIVMIIFSAGFAIPTIIEGVNVKRNMQSYSQNNQEIAQGSYKVIKLSLKDNYRISAIVTGHNSSNYPSEYVPVVFAILSEEQFSYWYDSGETKPNIINSTYYYESASISVENLGIEDNQYHYNYYYDNDYYFIVYNDNNITISVDLDLTIIPYGHIMAVSIVGFGFALCFLGLLAKIGFTTYFMLSHNEKPKILTVQSQGKSESHLQPEERDENFCVSCGAPITKKDGNYCLNCGSSK